MPEHLPSVDFPTRRNDELLVEVAGEETLVFDQRSNVAHCLEPVAAQVWNACDGVTATTELADRTGLDASEVDNALMQLESIGLLEYADAMGEDPVSDKRISRRRLSVSIVGGTVAGAALVSSVAAPVASAATSCPAGQCLCAFRCTCTRVFFGSASGQGTPFCTATGNCTNSVFSAVFGLAICTVVCQAILPLSVPSSIDNVRCV